jgi:hypothetical protein
MRSTHTIRLSCSGSVDELEDLKKVTIQDVNVRDIDGLFGKLYTPRVVV